MLFPALLTIVGVWSQTKYLSTGEWLKKSYIYTWGDFISHKEKNTIFRKTFEIADYYVKQNKINPEKTNVFSLP